MPDLRSDLNDFQLRMEDELENHGFYIEFEYHSTLFRRDLKNDWFIYISDDGGISIPKDEDSEIIVGLHSADGRDFSTVRFKNFESYLDYLNVHMVKLYGGGYLK